MAMSSYGCPIVSFCEDHCKEVGFSGGRCDGTFYDKCNCYGY